jgi:hypothetical protein
MSVDDIIARSKAKQALWKIQEQQEARGEDDVALHPEGFDCPICYEQMQPPNRRPITLFPCGHSVCEQCLASYERSSGQKKCSVCSGQYQKTAVNFAMLSIIENAGPPRGPQRDFAQELSLAKARLELLSGEYRRTCDAGKRLKGQLDTEMRVMNVLDDELRFVQEQHRQQREKVDQMKGDEAQAQRSQDELKGIIDPLLIEIEKLKLLAEGTRT